MNKQTFLKIFGWVMALALLPTSSLAQTNQTLGPKQGCNLTGGNCHAKENPWWSKDPHFSSAKIFKSPTERYQSVAQKYGISLDNAAQVNDKCMNCHGTVISTRATSTIATDGVSCESCHGPGSGYKEPHAEEGKGYTIGITFGMTKNEDLNVRAAMCVKCHYISDPQLLAAGHLKGSVGFSFYIDEGMTRIAKHWRTHGVEPKATLKPAFDKALRARGATPVEKDPNRPKPPAPGGIAGGETPKPGPPDSKVAPTTPPPSSPPVVKPAQVPVYEDVIEPPSKYQTLGPKGSNGCGLGQQNCHAKENDWWMEDEKPNQRHKHYNTYRKFIEPAGLYIKYLKKYGIDGNQAKINQVCMKCHGTVITAKADKEVTVGVSCESCHGPGSGYRDPHAEVGKSYAIGITLGLVENKKLAVRARTCARCHYITEQKLIALTGHSSGDDFEYFEAIQQLRPHWKPNRPAENEDSLKATYALAIQAKGPLVSIAEDDNKPQPESGNVAPEIIESGEAQPEKNQFRQPVAQPGETRPRRNKNVQPITLRPFATVVDTTGSLQNLIITLKRRLEELSKAGLGDQP